MKWRESQGAMFELRRVVVSARELDEEPVEGNVFCPFAPLGLGIESINGISKRLSSSSGRPIVRFRTSPLNKARAIPKAKPPPAVAREILFRFLVSSPGREGRCTALMLGILDGSRASSTRAFSSAAVKYL